MGREIRAPRAVRRASRKGAEIAGRRAAAECQDRSGVDERRFRAGAAGLTQQTENNTGQHCSRFASSPLSRFIHSPFVSRRCRIICSIVEFRRGTSASRPPTSPHPPHPPHFPSPTLYPSFVVVLEPSRSFFHCPARTAYVFPFFSRDLKGEMEGKEEEEETATTDCSVYSERKGDDRLYYLSRS